MFLVGLFIILVGYSIVWVIYLY